MKKTLIALAVLGATAGVAHAQSNVTVYGMVDTGFVKETGKSLRMDENHNSRLGFRGQEDLGNGLKATFQLEARMKVNDGTENGTRAWDGASNLGLASSSWGAVRFGRLNELSTETYRTLDPFNQDGIAGGYRSSQRVVRLSNTVRYDSPNMGGLKAGLSYTLSRDGSVDNTGAALSTPASDARNHGYAASLKYDNGPVTLLGNWSRIADSDNSSVWNLGGAYSFGDIRVSLGYERTRDEGFRGGNNTNASSSTLPAINATTNRPLYSEKQENWIVGLEWKLGPGVLGASYNRGKMKDVTGFNPADSANSLTANQYAIGYTYNLSKRTSLYANVAYNDLDNNASATFYNKGADDDSIMGYAVGMTHKF